MVLRDKLPGNGRGAEKHYGVLSVEDICRFPLPPLVDDALLFLWRVSSQVEEAYQVVRAWGFTPKSELVWVKTTKDARLDEEAPALAFGMGRYVRAAHETCIVAAKGKATSLIRDHAVRSVFYAPREEHSKKPEAFYDLVERLAGGPYCELFARRQRPGWQCYGDQSGGAAHPKDRFGRTWVPECP